MERIFAEEKQSIIHCDKPTKSEEHPTMKPIKLCAELVARKKPQAKITFLQALNYIYFQLQDEAWGMNRVKEYRQAAIEAARGFFKRHEALYECGSTERLNFFNECRKHHGTPIMESQTFNQFMEEICK